MDEQDLLIQRFLDHDLTLEERVAFLRMIDEDPDLRRSWLNLELVVAEAGQLPRMTPSAKFYSELKAKITPRSLGWWERLSSVIRAPRTLEWNLAGAIAAACVAIVSIVGVFAVIPPRVIEVPAPPPPGQTIVTRVEQKEPKVFVRLILLQPAAASVSVAGDFNGWNKSAHPLQAVGTSGLWEGFVAGVEPGAAYRYHLVSREHGYQVAKADPFGFRHEPAPGNASVVWELD